MPLEIEHRYRPFLATKEQHACHISVGKEHSIRDMIRGVYLLHPDVASPMRIMKDERLKAISERVDNSITLKCTQWCQVRKC